MLACATRTVRRKTLAGRPRYVTPDPLEGVQILDLLELTGSQTGAAQALDLHQSTISRSLQRLREQFRLQPRRGARVCRQGLNDSLRFLRLAARAHRRMEGLLRLSTDPLHQPLLEGLEPLQPVPPRFREADEWAELVAHALLDGAIVSSIGLDGSRLDREPPHRAGLKALPLGPVAVHLVAAQPDPRGVLLPRRQATPQLHRQFEARGLAVEIQPMACMDAASWLKRMRDRSLALPLCCGLLEKQWIESQGLVRLEAPPLREQLWLLLPAEEAHELPALRRCHRLLRLRLQRAAGAEAVASTSPRRG